MPKGSRILRSGLLVMVLLLWGFSMPFYCYEDPFVAPWEKEGPKRAEPEPKIKRSSKEQRSVTRSGVKAERKRESVFPKPKKEKPLFKIDGIIWDNTGTGIVISGDHFYRIGDYINKDCKISQLAGREVLVSCGEDVWKYNIIDNE